MFCCLSHSDLRTAGLASPLNTKQNTFAEHAASSAAFTSLTFTATPTLPWLSRARAQTVTALGSFSRVPLELLPSPWLPGVATSQLHPGLFPHEEEAEVWERRGPGLGAAGESNQAPTGMADSCWKTAVWEGIAACYPCKRGTAGEPSVLFRASSLCYLTVNQSLIFVLHVQWSTCSCRRKIPKAFPPSPSVGHCLGWTGSGLLWDGPWNAGKCLGRSKECYLSHFSRAPPLQKLQGKTTTYTHFPIFV